MSGRRVSDIRDRDTIDAELRLLAAVRWSIPDCNNFGEPRLPSDTITSGRPVSADGRSFQSLYRSLSWCVV